jgi:hypothetical protein
MIYDNIGEICIPNLKIIKIEKINSVTQFDFEVLLTFNRPVY